MCFDSTKVTIIIGIIMLLALLVTGAAIATCSVLLPLDCTVNHQLH